MTQIAYLQTSLKTAKYNEQVRKALEKAKIPYTEQSTKFGKRIMVDSSFYVAGSKAVLSVSYKF
jgi:hypothetical protein